MPSCEPHDGDVWALDEDDGQGDEWAGGGWQPSTRYANSGDDWTEEGRTSREGGNEKNEGGDGAKPFSATARSQCRDHMHSQSGHIS